MTLASCTHISRLFCSYQSLWWELFPHVHLKSKQHSLNKNVETVKVNRPVLQALFKESLFKAATQQQPECDKLINSQRRGTHSCFHQTQTLLILLFYWSHITHPHPFTSLSSFYINILLVFSFPSHPFILLSESPHSSQSYKTTHPTLILLILLTHFTHPFILILSCYPSHSSLSS